MTVTAPPRVEAPRRAVARRVVRGFGWTALGLGALLALFVLYEIFGTGMVTAGHQADLRRELGRELRSGKQGSGGGKRDGRPPQVADPEVGDPVGVLRIPRVGLNMVFVEGVGVDELKKGPAHYPTTPLPGEEGNVGLAGHRTTYARPFWALNVLEPGDPIFVRTPAGRFVYEVAWQRVVSPDNRTVLGPTSRPSLTLTTCNPRFSAAERLIVRAVLVRGPPGEAAA